MSIDEITWSRSIPVRYEADVAVIGGGIAGVSAACAAARSGARVVLVERFAVTGGVLTTGGVANFCGQMTGQGEVFDQIVADLNAWHALGYGAPRDRGNGAAPADRATANRADNGAQRQPAAATAATGGGGGKAPVLTEALPTAAGPAQRTYKGDGKSLFHYEILGLVLQELLLRRRVKLLFHTRFVDVQVDDRGTISECIVCGKSGPEALRASVFIDCSGDGDVARRAGFAVTKGGASRFQLPMSMMFFVRHVAEHQLEPHLPAGWLEPVQREQDLPMTTVWPDGDDGSAIKLKVPMFDATDTESLTQAEISARRRMMEVLDYFQRRERRPFLLDHASPTIGIREGCRIAGDYELTVADLRAGRAFEDGVARGTFYLDGHKPDDEQRTYILPRDQLAVPPYQIPLRSLIARDGRNLMMAGRCFSADQLALSSARVSTSASMMGQAVGITAALAAAAGCPVRDVDPAEVRRIVLQRGGLLAVD